MRKLLSVTCIASHLTASSLAFAQSQQTSSWGMLKTRYGQPEGIQRTGLNKQVADAILNSPLLNDPNVKAVYHMGKDDLGSL